MTLLVLRGRSSLFGKMGLWLGLFTLTAVNFPGDAKAQSIAWEARWDGGLVDSEAEAWDVVIGPSGAAYATGIIFNGGRRDILTLAWTASGTQLWHRLKSGSQDSDDFPAQIAVDGDGRIVVAGTARRSPSGWESLVVVVYDVNGNELWSRTRQLPTFRQNRAQGLAIGSDGQIIAVSEIGNGSTQGMSLVAYSSEGDLLWDRERTMDPCFRALAMGPTGVLAVAGKAIGGGDADFLTLAFDSAGNELWAETRDGAAGGDDTVEGMVLDSGGRFVVSGASETAAFDTDILSVTYDDAGNEVWTATTGSPNDERLQAIAADTSGNVFVIGSSNSPTGSGPSTIRVSYDSTGAERWAMSGIDTPGERSSFRRATVLATGDLVVAGSRSFAVSLYDRALVVQYDGSTGAENWAETRLPTPGYNESISAVSADLTGALFAVGRSSSSYLENDVLAASYGPTGTELWDRKEPLISAEDIPGSYEGARGNRCIATGYDGRVYVAGTSFDGRTLDYLTVAYNAFGYKLWQARTSTSNDFLAQPSAIAVDPNSGNVYVTGWKGTEEGSTYLTVAYDRSGAEVWSRTRQGDGFGSKHACCIAVDAQGLIFVTGSTATREGGGGPRILTVAYESGGNEVWSDGWGMGDFTSDFASSLTVGTAGTVYVAGSSYPSGGGLAQTVTLAYDPSGARLWSRTHPVDSGASAQIGELAPTADGGIAASGEVFGSGFEDILTVVYRPDGSERWSAIADSLDGGLDVASAIAVDSVGRTFVTGSSWNPDYSDPDYITVAYSPAGALLWTREYAGPSGGEDLAGSLAIGSNGTLFVTGESSNGLNSDFLTLAYSPGGYQQFEHRYDAGGEDDGYLAIAGPEGSAYIGGMSTLYDRDFFLFELLDQTGLFADGFEVSDYSAWSVAVP